MCLILGYVNKIHVILFYFCHMSYLHDNNGDEDHEVRLKGPEEVYEKMFNCNI